MGLFKNLEICLSYLSVLRLQVAVGQMLRLQRYKSWAHYLLYFRADLNRSITHLNVKIKYGTKQILSVDIFVKHFVSHGLFTCYNK